VTCTPFYNVLSISHSDSRELEGNGEMMHDLQGKTALVTGASRGLGAAIARKLAACGARTAINYFGSPQKAHRLQEQIRGDGGTAEIYQADVRDEASVAAMVGQVTKQFGPIDILVLNATGPQPFVKLDDLTWRQCLDQLEFFVKSPVLLAKAVLTAMKERRSGRIVNIGSEVFERGVPEFSNYVSAKGAQLGLTRSWAMELAPWQITVNLVAPGWIPTERHVDDSQESKDAYAAAVPLKHMGDPVDVAEAVAFLASEGARFITGQKIAVNGGNTLA
jgi:NAD(P)-dependent dehydrogenase (short-subunit alcohol dehydrogenase family)